MQDILRHIHAKMTLRDAARAACASHTFRHNWICRPNLTFSLGTLGLNRNASRDVITRDLISKIDLIMQNRSGIGVKTLDIDLYSCDNIDFAYLDSWLRIAVTPGIEELILTLPLPLIVIENALPIISVYNFPCSLLSNGRKLNSISQPVLLYLASHGWSWLPKKPDKTAYVSHADYWG